LPHPAKRLRKQRIDLVSMATAHGLPRLAPPVGREKLRFRWRL